MPQHVTEPAKIVVIGDQADEMAGRLASGPDGPSYDVAPRADPPEPGDAVEADLVLIDTVSQSDVVDTVRACRDHWPVTTPVVVVNLPDPVEAIAAIDAGATDALAPKPDPLLSAHVRRLLRASDAVQALLQEERDRAAGESFALAAADIAVPLGELLDALESVMASTPSREMEGLLDSLARTIDAVDRLREMAARSTGQAAEVAANPAQAG